MISGGEGRVCAGTGRPFVFVRKPSVLCEEPAATHCHAPILSHRDLRLKVDSPPARSAGASALRCLRPAKASLDR